MSLVINFEPQPIQYEAWKLLFDKTTTQILFGGSVRVGKSFLAVAWAAIYCLAYPHIHIGVCRARLSALKKTTLQTLLEFFRIYGLKEDEHYVFNRTDMILEFNNGSKIFFLELYSNPSDPEFERIMSLSLTAAVVDEVSEISASAIGKLQTRLSHMLIEYDLVPKLLLVTNPSKNWLYTDYYKPYIEGTLPEYRKVILGLPQDNKYVSKTYIDNLENSLDAVTKSRLLYGNWEYTNDDLAIFNYDDILQMYYNDQVGEGNYLSCDIANVGKDKTVICVWKGLEVINIYTYSKKNTPEIVDIIKEKMKTFKVPIKNVVIDADGLGIGVADYLKGCVPFKGGSSALNKENYINLRSQCFYKFSEKVKEVKLPDIHKEEVAQELQQIKLVNIDNDGKTQVISKDKIKDIIGRSTDYADALMMRFYYETKKVRITTYVY